MKRESFSERLELRLPPEWDRKLSAQAVRAVTTKSELARQAIIARLRELEPMPQAEVA
jgi:predicted DNA-binding protein